MDTPINIKRHISCEFYDRSENYPFKTGILQSDESAVLASKDRMMLVFVDGKSTHYLLDDGTEGMEKAPFILFLENDREISLTVDQKSRVSFVRFKKLKELCPSFSVFNLKTHAPTSMEFTTLEIVEPLKDIVASLVRYYEDGLRCEDMIQVKVQEVLFVIGAYYEPERIAKLLAPLLRREVDFKEFVMQNHLHVDKVKELADLRGMSLRNFNEEFKETFGKPPYTWMLEQKAILIEERLAENVSFSEIIEEFRFSSPSHFTVFCRNHFGMTPSKKRNLLRQQKRLRASEEARRNEAAARRRK